MTDWDEAITAATATFVELLERLGFRNDGGLISGTVEVDGRRVPIRVQLPEAFPFAPPTVMPPTCTPRSWHRELDGAMCLYTAGGREGLPWLDVDDFMATVVRWLHESATGWAADSPDLALDRYFPRAEDKRLLVYGDLDEVTGQFIRLRHKAGLTHVVGPGSIPMGKKWRKESGAFGYVAAIGEPPEPPGSWDELGELLDVDIARQIEIAIRQERLTHLIVRYRRGGTSAALALHAWTAESGAIQLASIPSASAAPEDVRLRAGYQSRQLGDAKVAVIGAGAIGSFLCDLLARSGVGHLTIWDFDLVRPGNLIRHLATEQYMGMAKPEAVRRVITSRTFNSTIVETVSEALTLPSALAGLFDEHDLVVDATAAGSTSDMLGRAAEALGHRLISVGLQEEGRVVRVDLVPPIEGDPIPTTTLSTLLTTASLQFEAGCGDPVSQTPPFAVVEAAALAARCVVAILVGEHVEPAGTIRDYRK